MMTDAVEPPKKVPPRDAATLILMDFKGKIPKILMGRRHSGHAFMPDKFVFPGGRVDPSDRRMNIASPLDQRVEDQLLAKTIRPSSMKARALALAAIRETFEETGIMLGEKGLGAPPLILETPWARFTKQAIWPSLDQLYFVARAITPPRYQKRFDTRFFLTDASNIAHIEEGIIGPNAELTETIWVPLTRAKSLDLPSITAKILDEVTERLNGGLNPFLPVPFYHEVRGQYIRELI
jgi:8-oxo-dGTP pyrophosphatase MutT (NUDIX family)